MVLYVIKQLEKLTEALCCIIDVLLFNFVMKKKETPEYLMVVNKFKLSLRTLLINKNIQQIVLAFTL